MSSRTLWLLLGGVVLAAMLAWLSRRHDLPAASIDLGLPHAPSLSGSRAATSVSAPPTPDVERVEAAPIRQTQGPQEPEDDFGQSLLRALVEMDVCSGRVIDASGAAVPGAEVDSRGSPLARARAGADGSFRMHSLRVKREILSNVELRIVAKHPDYCVSDEVTVAVGDSGVVLMVGFPSSLRGLVLADASIRLEQLTVLAVDDSSSAEAPEIRRANGHGGRALVAADGSFTFEKLCALSVSLSLFEPSSATPLAEIPNVALFPGRDRYLDPIDLRGRVNRLRLEVVGPKGERVFNVRLAIRPSDEPSAAPTYFSCQDGLACSLTVPGLPVDLEVRAPLYQLTRVERVHGDQRIVLAPAPVLELWVPPTSFPAGNYVLGVRLLPLERPRDSAAVIAAGMTVTTEGMAGPTSDEPAVQPEDNNTPYGRPSLASTRFDRSGHATLHAPGPGRYRVKVEVRDTQHRVETAAESEIEVAAGGSIVRLDLTRAEVEVAEAALRERGEHAWRSRSR